MEANIFNYKHKKEKTNMYIDFNFIKRNITRTVTNKE